ncbi:MAG: NUDIX domain-containing protein [Candidatus Paceibacterota bacterium]|jgi:8-oxo-dGTP diphosphatase
MESKKNLKSEHLKFAVLAVDAVCFRVKEGVLELLLGKIGSDNNIYKGQWAHIGGLIYSEETADQSVDRLLGDKGGIKNIHREQLYTFSDIDRDPRGRVVSVAYIALTNNDDIQNKNDAELETKWCPLSNLPKLAYDHNEITKVAVERLRSKIIYTDIAKYFMPTEFTLSELQKVYEAVLGEGMDKRNFRKRIISLNLLKNTKKTVKKGVMRPATLYTFK